MTRPADHATDMWRCVTCHKFKIKLDFYPDNRLKSGVRGDCKVCYRTKVRAGQAEYRLKVDKHRVSVLGLPPKWASSARLMSTRSDKGVKRPREAKKANWPAIYKESPATAPITPRADDAPVAPRFTDLFQLPTPIKE